MRRLFKRANRHSIVVRRYRNTNNVLRMISFAGLTFCRGRAKKFCFGMTAISMWWAIFGGSISASLNMNLNMILFWAWRRSRIRDSLFLRNFTSRAFSWVLLRLTNRRLAYRGPWLSRAWSRFRFGIWSNFFCNSNKSGLGFFRKFSYFYFTWNYVVVWGRSGGGRWSFWGGQVLSDNSTGYLTWDLGLFVWWFRGWVLF